MQFCSFVGLGFCSYFYYVKRFWTIGNFYRMTMQFCSFVGLGFCCYFYYVKRLWTIGNQHSTNIVYYYYYNLFFAIFFILFLILFFFFTIHYGTQENWGAYHLTEKSGWGVESIMVSDLLGYRRVPHPLRFESIKGANLYSVNLEPTRKRDYW